MKNTKINIQEFYNRFCCIDDGNAAKRVCEKSIRFKVEKINDL